MNSKFAKIFFQSVLIVLITTSLKAQFSIDAQFRNRAEFRDGYKKLAYEGSIPSIFNTQQTRLSFSYKSENLKIKITPQDVRIWGNEQNVSFSGNNGNNSSIDLFEAYAELKLSKCSWLSVGRQTLSFDNQSIIANPSWNLNGNASDAIVFKIDTANWKLQIVGSWNSLKNTDNLYPTTRYKSLNILWLNRKFNKNLNASFIHIASGVTETDTTNAIKFRQTSGLFIDYKKNNFIATGDAYYQYGKSQKNLNINALMFDATVGYKINFITSNIGISYLSGKYKTVTDISKDYLFDPIYRSRHGFFGEIDYFTDLIKHTKNGGLIDLYLSFKAKITKKIELKNSTHYFKMANSVPTIPGKILGYENDFVFKYKFNEWGTFSSGYMFFIPTNALKTIQSVPNNKFSQFAYLQLTLTPNLFSQK